MSPRTIDSYTYHVARFEAFLDKDAQRATVEDVRRFQLWLIEEKHASWSAFNQAVCALKFLYRLIYLHVRRPHLESTPSPIDWLPVRQLPGWTKRDPRSSDQNNSDQNNSSES